MRHALRTLTTAATAAACLLTVTAATATTATAQDRAAGPASLYAPSDLVLAVGHGESAAAATVTRSVTLTCAPRATGTHPAPKAACAELDAIDGQFAELQRPAPDAFCTKEWDPVTVFAVGVWEGRQVNWSATFGNRCALQAELAESAALAF